MTTATGRRYRSSWPATSTEFATYIRVNAHLIPNYGERHRCGEAISSAMAESAVNQVISKRMVKKQQMRWSPSVPSASSRSALPC